MITNLDKNKERIRRHSRVRDKISGTVERPRLSIYRSLAHMYAQIIDDQKGATLVSANTMEKSLQASLKGKTKLEQAYIVGQEVAKRAKAQGIEHVVFDRSGYIYSGRIKKVVDVARDAGLQF